MHGYLNEGWGREAKQFFEPGSSRGLILSLLRDHCRNRYPEQITRIENKREADTAQRLQRRAQMDALLEFISSLLVTTQPNKKSFFLFGG